LVVLQHPVTTEHDQAEHQATILLDVVRQQGLPALWFWPNIDAGSDATSKAIRRHREFHPDSPIHFFKNMEGKDFLRTLRRAKCLAGNSSVGIRECSYLGVPVVNLGSRQQGRERGENVLDVMNWNRDEIALAIAHQVNHGFYPRSELYGNGTSGPRIAEAIREMPLTCEKRLTY
jgi:UDP-N-acetylglucosamine 2-epimerase